MKVKIPIRLYRRHDMDLLVLYKNPNFGFQKALKAALVSYIRKEPYFIHQPETVDVSGFNFKYVYHCFLQLDNVEDADIIKWLSGVKEGHRNQLLKSLLRGAIIGPTVYGCMETDTDRQDNKELSEATKEQFDDVLEAPVRNKAKQKQKDKSNTTQSPKKTNKPKQKNTTQPKKNEALSGPVINTTAPTPVNTSADTVVQKQDDTNNTNNSNKSNSIDTDFGFDFGEGFGLEDNQTDTAGDNTGFDLFADIQNMLQQF